MADSESTLEHIFRIFRQTALATKYSTALAKITIAATYTHAGIEVFVATIVV